MKKTLIKGLALAAVGSLLLVGNASAMLLSGSIGMGGTWKDTGGDTGNDDLSDATGIDFITTYFTVGYGDLAPLNGLSIMPSDFTFNPFPVIGVQPLWQIAVDATNYRFDLTSLIVNSQLSNQINLSGSGIFTVDGYDPTPGQWTWTGNANGQSFTWSDSANTVPEPATMLLFGAGLAGFAGFRRKKS